MGTFPLSVALTSSLERSLADQQTLIGTANSSTYVARRFEKRDWTRDGELLTMSHRIDDVDGGLYVRVRGTNTGELEPEPDPAGEDPWADLWFYSNPVFVRFE